MRPGWTLLVVVALAALGLAAVFDALRGEERVREVREATRVDPVLARQPELAVSQLREAGVRGVLTFSDEECRLRAVSLPELEEVRAPSFEMCRPATASESIGTMDGDVVWAGLGYGAVQVVLSDEQLSRALRAELRVPPDGEARFSAVQAVSLGDNRYVVLVEGRYVSPQSGELDERVLAVFDADDPLLVQPGWIVGQTVALRPSPDGSYFAALKADEEGLALFRRDGTAVELPRLPDAQAIAWSPDERWTALATPESVYVFRSERPEELVVRIPLEVNDLDWSDEPVQGRLP